MTRSSPRTLAARAAPWLLGIAGVAVVLWRTDLAALREAFAGADWLRFAAAAAVFVALWLAVDAWVLARLVSRFHGPISWRAMVPLRGATYAALALSYDAAQAALVWLLRQRMGVPLAALGGTFLFYYLVDLLTISGLGLLGSAALPDRLAGPLRVPLLLAFVALAVGLGAGARLAASPPRWMRGRPVAERLLATLRTARLRDVAEFAAWRAGFYATFVAFAAVTLPAFGIHVPLLALVGCVPLVMSVSALPITVAGLGSTQVAMWALYGPFADAAAVVAYSLAYTATLVLLRVPVGALFLAAARSRAGAASETWLERERIHS